MGGLVVGAGCGGGYRRSRVGQQRVETNTQTNSKQMKSVGGRGACQVGALGASAVQHHGLCGWMAG